jgi:hypothetical protein
MVGAVVVMGECLCFVCSWLADATHFDPGGPECINLPFQPSQLPKSSTEPAKWYTAVISEIVQEEGSDEDKYLVTFDGYGNQEVVTLGDMMLPPQPKKDEGGGGGGGGGGAASSSSRRRSRSRSRCVLVFGRGLCCGWCVMGVGGWLVVWVCIGGWMCRGFLFGHCSLSRSIS